MSATRTNERRRPDDAYDGNRSGRSRRGRSRKGALLSTELLFVLPILAGLLFAMVEFSMLLSAKQQIKSASRLACRVASLPAADPVQLEHVVRGAAEQGLVRSSLIESYELRFDPGQNTGDEVVAEVRVPMRAAAPNLLSVVGFNLKGRHLTARTVMRKE